jgi:niacin transporter
MKKFSTFKLAITGLLIAVGIVIPLFSPVKIPLGPFGSFTLASHVTIFIAMFISPATAVAVAVGTAIGFFAAFPLVIGLRAATHVIFAFLGAWYLQKVPRIVHSHLALRGFSFVIALIHAAAEVLVVSALFFGGRIGGQGYIETVLLSVGLVTVVHSMVDFEIAGVVRLALRKIEGLRDLFVG